MFNTFKILFVEALGCGWEAWRPIFAPKWLHLVVPLSQSVVSGLSVCCVAASGASLVAVAVAWLLVWSRGGGLGGCWGVWQEGRLATTGVCG